MRMITEPRTVDQTGMRALIWERLEQPEIYADRPLFIYQAEWLDGIQQHLAIDASLEFNKGKAREDWSYFRLITVRDNNTCLKGPGEKGRLVGYVVNTRDLPLDEYLIILNKLIEDNKSSLPMIVYLPFRFRPIDLPGEHYISNPDFEQWAKKWIDPTIPDFIRGDGDKAGITYRWYNRYDDPDRGCNMPVSWMSLSSNLHCMMKARCADRISKLDEASIKESFCSVGGISPDIVAAFTKYVKQL